MQHCRVNVEFRINYCSQVREQHNMHSYVLNVMENSLTYVSFCFIHPADNWRGLCSFQTMSWKS